MEEEENDTLDLESELYQDFDYLDESKNSQDFDDYFAEPEIDDISDLEESEIFGYNRFNEPIRFVLVYSPVNNQHYVKPEFYRANRWCRQIHDTSMNLCPHKKSPKFDLSDTSRWQYLIDASSGELNRLFEEKYGNNPDYDKMYQAFKWYSNEQNNYFKADYVNTTQEQADYLASVDELDADTIPVNDPAAISWINSNNILDNHFPWAM